MGRDEHRLEIDRLFTVLPGVFAKIDPRLADARSVILGSRYASTGWAHRIQGGRIVAA